MKVEGIVRRAAIAQPGNWYCVFLLPWRHPDGRIIDVQLRVAPRATPARAKAAERSFRAGVSLRVVAAKFVKPPGFSYWNAERIQRVEKVKPLSLEELSPVSLRDPKLGRLALDRGLGAFVGKRGRAQLFVDRRASGPLPSAAARVLAIEAKLSVIRAAIAKRLLRLYNDTWRESSRELDATAFDKRLVLSSIWVGPTRTTLNFESGHLFGDHGVEVRLSARGAIREILIA